MKLAIASGNEGKVFGNQSTAIENWCCEWKWKQGYFEVSRQSIKIDVASGSAGRGVLMSIDINENWRGKTWHFSNGLCASSFGWLTCPSLTRNNNNVHLSCAHQRPERAHDTY